MVQLWATEHFRYQLQVASLCAQANSVSYPQRDEKWVVAYGLWVKAMAVWGDGMSAWYIGGCPLEPAMDGRIMRHGIISSCQSAATYRYCEALLALSLLM